MNRVLVGGLVFTPIGVLAYTVGLTVPYAGRSLSVTVVMVGITMLAIGRAIRDEGDAVR